MIHGKMGSYPETVTTVYVPPTPTAPPSNKAVNSPSYIEQCKQIDADIQKATDMGIKPGSSVLITDVDLLATVIGFQRRPLECFPVERANVNPLILRVRYLNEDSKDVPQWLYSSVALDEMELILEEGDLCG